MTGEASENFLAFYQSLRGGDPQWREELDLGSLLALTGDERTDAEDLLIDKLDGGLDVRVPPALAAMRSERADKPLETMLPKTKGLMRAAIALALVELGVRPSIDEVLIDMLALGDEDGALACLAEVRRQQGPLGKRLEQAMIASAQDNPSSTVRGECAFVLLRRHGVLRNSSDKSQDALLRKFYGNDAGERQLARDELCRALAAS